MRKIVHILLASIIFLSFTFSASAEILLFLGEGCPHCDEVKKYIDENDLKGKLDIQEYEIYYNTEDKLLYEQKSHELGYSGDRVPLLIDGTKFKDGTEGVIDYLKELSETEPVLQTDLDDSINDEGSGELNKIIGDLSEETSDINIPEDAQEGSPGLLIVSIIAITLILLFVAFSGRSK